MTKWYHVECFPFPRKLKSQGETEESFVANILADEAGILDDDEKRGDIITKLTQKGGAKAENGKPKGASGYVAAAKQIWEKMEEIGDEKDAIGYDEDVHPKKKVKTSTANSEFSRGDKSRGIAYGFYKDCNIDTLKDFLRWNRQTVTGTKDVLLTRCIDGHVNGRIGLCLTCGQGKLRLNDSGNEVSCSGYYNEEYAYKENCPVKMPIERAPRLQPWYSREPSEEEKEKIDAIFEAAKNPTAARASEIQAGKTQLSEEIGNLEWNMDSPKGIKKAASDMLEVIARDATIDLPGDQSKARMGIGKLILTNKSKSALEILELVIEQYGFKATKDEAIKRKSEALESLCGHPANTPALQAILELSNLYSKEGNSNASGTYRKVGEAIKALDFEITEENAKGLGKGKTKVQGIGKGSAEKLFEFVTTGTIEKLEEKRAALS
eukprot:CAMPEP_0184858632 /NCGR_PEP_ID=MMETSP0580-20130426/3718_1 /TAXON_ID=1118495 /ORGANISM="Dactyliosolen fragilissimus" /LENGTH=436 /DNA_ID=CAMNT_0027354885 /DNA_START=251 /DNA_END=1561 /DNA_ORIENTATION=-